MHSAELRLEIYEGGVEPSFRKVIWQHLLNIFPENMTSSERTEYLKDVSVKYEKYLLPERSFQFYVSL